MTSLRIGIIGSGGMARHHAATFSKREDAELVAVASRNAETGNALANAHQVSYEADWRTLCAREDVDGIVVCTHNDSHGEIATLALANGKHVLMEYPLARNLDEGYEAARLAKVNGRVLRVTHPEAVSPTHHALKDAARELGDLLLASFLRLTPGRGARPEILFNLPVTGPPAHFFIYHLYPVVYLFGGAEWVEAGAEYEGLREDGRYNRFANTVSVRFKNGGIGQWAWAGGVEIASAEQESRYVLSGGTLSDAGDRWTLSRMSGVEPLRVPERTFSSLESLWLDEIRSGDPSQGEADTLTALDAMAISLNAEVSMKENRRVFLC